MENDNLKMRFESKIKLHFNLKQMREENKLTQIMLITTVNGKRIRVYTKMRVEPMFWDRKRNRCRTDLPINRREKERLMLINKRIESLTHVVCQMDDKLANSARYLSTSIVRMLVEERCHTETMEISPIAQLYKQIEEYCEGVNRRGKRGMSSTQKTYHTALKRLENYCECNQLKIKSFDDFDKKFFYGFANYLYTYTYTSKNQHLQYTQNTIVNTLKVIKNLLHRAYDNEMTDNNYFQRVQTTLSADVSEQVYLQEKEIEKLAQIPVSGHERIIRDMFIIACYTALRVSDIQNLDKAVIRNGIITTYQVKTKEEVQIPILKEIAPLIAYYQNCGFSNFCANKANETIKKLAKRCGIDEEVNYRECRGGMVHIRTAPKWQLISFHTARRSCITNLYRRGYPINYIMSLSGHRSVQAFQRYMRASSRELMSNFVRLLKKEKAL